MQDVPSVLAALLLFMDVLYSNTNVLVMLSVLTLQRKNRLTNLCWQHFNAFIDKHTQRTADHTDSLKTLELHILFITSCFIPVQCLRVCFLALGWRCLSHILMGRFKIIGIWCMSSDWQWLFFPLHFQSTCITSKDFYSMYYFLMQGPFCSQKKKTFIRAFAHSEMIPILRVFSPTSACSEEGGSNLAMWGQTNK